MCWGPVDWPRPPGGVWPYKNGGPPPSSSLPQGGLTRPLYLQPPPSFKEGGEHRAAAPPFFSHRGGFCVVWRGGSILGGGLFLPGQVYSGWPGKEGGGYVQGLSYFYNFGRLAALFLELLAYSPGPQGPCERGFNYYSRGVHWSSPDPPLFFSQICPVGVELPRGPTKRRGHIRQKIRLLYYVPVFE